MADGAAAGGLFGAPVAVVIIVALGRDPAKAEKRAQRALSVLAVLIVLLALVAVVLRVVQ